MRLHPEKRRAVLLNDTSFTPHHGCRSVVAAIRAGLAQRGIEIVASTPSGAFWEDSREFLLALATADLIVINGEGTLHHGAAAGERLLRIARHPLRDGRPVALINTLWQDNPRSWYPFLRQIDLISVRDSRSQRELAGEGISARLCPDFSFYHAWADQRCERNGELHAFGDSVFRDVSQELFDSFRKHRGPKLYLPIRSRRRREAAIGRLSMRQHWRNMKHNVRARVRLLIDPNQVTTATASEYAAHLARCGLHLTGRYHGACLSIATGTPFVAVASNSHKIEALIDEVGLDPRRIASNVGDALVAGVGAFSDGEKEKIATWLESARQHTNDVFDNVAALAARKSAYSPG